MGVRKFEAQWGGKTLSVETGKLAHQANGSCTLRYGDTVLLATATMAKEARENIDFFPLSVDYEEKFYAAGKIKSSRFVKREGRPSDEAVMTGRMIDRALRPLFPQACRHEVQVVVECLCIDMENDSDILGLVAGSCALAVSDIPWEGPIGGIRVGRVGGEMVINPTFEAQAKSDLDVIVAGTPDRVIMLEANGKEIPEAEMLEAILFGQKHLKEPIDLITQVREAVGKPKQDPATLTGADPDETADQRKELADLIAEAKSFVESKLDTYLFTGPKVAKLERYAALDKLAHELEDMLKSKQVDEERRAKVLAAFDGIIDAAVSRAIIEKEKRCDGRSLTDIRPLSAEVALLPRTHGTGLFMRGETQVLSVVTLGGPGDAQILDGMDQPNLKKRYIHHYNFPPFATAETGRLGGSGRREIGHGGLAERALIPVLPEKESFPYTIRVVSEVLGSNGSSSQASICGSTLSLMDAGVPLKNPVAGIAMGLATDDKGNWKVLTDLIDLEDGNGGMDFKIGGSRAGITTIQLDTKTKGLSREIVEKTLVQGRDARLKILDVLEGAIAAPRAELSPYAPRIVTVKIDPEKIRDVIGPGGKMINAIIDETGATIDVENDGTVTVCSANKAGLDRAVQWIRDLTRQVEPGELFKTGKVTRIMDFGAFVEVLPGQEGLVHISELAPWRVNRVTDMVNINDIIPVKVVNIDELGRINLSHKAAKKDLGEEQVMPAGYKPMEPRGFGGRPGGGGRGGFGGRH